MNALPDCPSCDAARTLERVEVRALNGLIVVFCTCCSKVWLLSLDGKVLERDVNGVVIDGP